MESLDGMADLENEDCIDIVRRSNSTDELQRNHTDQATSMATNSSYGTFMSTPSAAPKGYDGIHGNSQQSSSVTDQQELEQSSPSSEVRPTGSGELKSALKRKGTDNADARNPVVRSSSIRTKQTIHGYALPKERKLKNLCSGVSAFVPAVRGGGGSTVRHSGNANMLSTDPAPTVSDPTAVDGRLEDASLPGSLRSANGISEPCKKQLISCLRRTPRARTTPANKKVVRFDKETVYHFERRQGFTSVPTQGGSTLGMSWTHHDVQEHALQDVDVNKSRPFSGDATENSMPYPISSQLRRELLRESGVLNIDPAEYAECKMIRASRERCGCDCMVRCDPLSCFCILECIPCQADSSGISCVCSQSGCQNPNGRTEFDAFAVRSHVIRTCIRANRELGLHTEHPSPGLQTWSNLLLYADNDSVYNVDSTDPAYCPPSSDAVPLDRAPPLRAIVNTSDGRRVHAEEIDNTDEDGCNIVASNESPQGQANSSYQAAGLSCAVTK